VYVAGDKVTYAGNMAECKGMAGVVKGPGSKPGRSVVEWPKLGSAIDMSDTVLEKEKEMPVPKIKLDILEIKGMKEFDGRSIDVYAVDRVRGDIAIRMDENTARWFFAMGMDKLNAWRKEDGE
jgi:hypothetical protein